MLIKLANKMPQAVTVHVRNGGRMDAVTLAPYSESDPLEQKSLEEHALQLIAHGHLRVRKA